MNAKEIITKLGGPTIVAASLGITSQAISLWASKNKIPAERCPELELLSQGTIKCEEMRPDVKWWVLREKRD